MCEKYGSIKHAMFVLVRSYVLDPLTVLRDIAFSNIVRFHGPAAVVSDCM